MKPTTEGRAVVFSCEGCGADLRFHPGSQRLKCDHCGVEKSVEEDPAAQTREQDFAAMLERLARRREEGQEPEPDVHEIRCTACGATVQFAGSLTGKECAYCGSPLQRDRVHDVEERIPVDGVLPFAIDRSDARKRLGAWIGSRWFAPRAFRRRGIEGRFNGVYAPYWTFDSLTTTRYQGERGEHYYVTVGSGKQRRRQRRTRWYPASGQFQQLFDDILVVASRDLPEGYVTALDPWPLDRCVPFNRQLLAGFLSRTYDLALDMSFGKAKEMMDRALDAEVRRRIGGDTQRVHAEHSRYEAVTYKHLLLPIWILAYRYRDNAYQVVVNGATGEVQGARPYSLLKIGAAVLAALAIAAVVVFLAR